jgi:hypothetical protein
MSNASDLALWALSQGDACPSLVDVQSALAAAHSSKFPKNGDVIYPGVTVVDAENGLVHIDAADAKAPGWRFSCWPTVDSLDPAGSGRATVELNTGPKRLADRGFGIWQGVDAVKPQANTAAPWVLDETKWLARASSVGSEFTTWPDVIAYVTNTWQPPKQ